MGHLPLISVIIPTIGRESLLRAVDSVLGQEVPGGSVEVIVVNDSGSAPSEEWEVLNDPRVTVISTNRRGQSVTRNTGAAMAQGRYLLFLDDDDHLDAGALASLLNAISTDSRYVVAYGGMSLVDATGRKLGSMNLGISGNCASHMLAGATIQFGSAIIDAEAFFSVGGINTSVARGAEMALFRRLSMVGDFANTGGAVVNVLRGEGWTTSMDLAQSAVESLRVTREEFLDARGAFRRLLRSADSPYWRGRVVKGYAASAYWSLKHGRPLKALGRAGYLALSLAASAASWLRGDFWRAMGDSQVDATFQRALADGKRAEVQRSRGES